MFRIIMKKIGQRPKTKMVLSCRWFIAVGWNLNCCSYLACLQGQSGCLIYREISQLGCSSRGSLTAKSKQNQAPATLPVPPVAVMIEVIQPIVSYFTTPSLPLFVFKSWAFRFVKGYVPFWVYPVPAYVITYLAMEIFEIFFSICVWPLPASPLILTSFTSSLHLLSSLPLALESSLIPSIWLSQSDPFPFHLQKCWLQSYEHPVN